MQHHEIGAFIGLEKEREGCSAFSKENLEVGDWRKGGSNLIVPERAGSGWESPQGSWCHT